MTNLEQKLYDVGLFPVITLKNVENAAGVAHALCEGGLPAAEVTFHVPGAAEVIRRMLEAEPDMLVGAGTVLTREQADEAIAAGACFIVTPAFSADIVKYCIEKQIPIMPGCATPSDVEAARALGLTTVKIFPAEAIGGLPAIKAIAAPYHMMKFVPTGGVSAENVTAYLSCPSVLACGGSFMMKSDMLEEGRFDEIRAAVREAVNAIFGFKLYHVGINAGKEADAGVRLLSEMFGQPVREFPGAYFYGNWFEVIRGENGRGRVGHIGIETDCIERAVAYFKRRGFDFIDESAGYDEKGKLTVIYFRQEIMGYALHLSQRK